MTISKHNIFSRIKNSDSWFIVNPLSQNADILDADLAREYQSADFSDSEMWQSKGYLVDPAAEEKQFKAGYLDWLDARDSDELQLFFVPSYACNFACTYCYQEGYQTVAEPFRQELVDAFFSYIDSEFAGRKKYITVFGGEPLLLGAGTRQTIGHVLAAAKQRGLQVAIVTNGYHLQDYLPILREGLIREIQVTLDGMQEMHDRHHANLARCAAALPM